MWSDQFWLIFIVLSSKAFAPLLMTIEPPNSIETSLPTRYQACEFFDELDAGFRKVPVISEFEPNVDGIKGTYTNLQIEDEEKYGLASYSHVGEGNETILRLTRPGFDGINYFGVWIIAITEGNTIEFFLKGQSLRKVDYTAMSNIVTSKAHLGSYYGKFKGRRAEAYFNFVCEDCLFDEVRFSQEKVVTKRKRHHTALATDHHCVEVLKIQPRAKPKQKELQVIEATNTIMVSAKNETSPVVTPALAATFSVAGLALLALILGGLFAFFKYSAVYTKTLTLGTAAFEQEEEARKRELREVQAGPSAYQWLEAR